MSDDDGDWFERAMRDLDAEETDENHDDDTAEADDPVAPEPEADTTADDETVPDGPDESAEADPFGGGFESFDTADDVTEGFGDFGENETPAEGAEGAEDDPFGGVVDEDSFSASDNGSFDADDEDPFGGASEQESPGDDPFGGTSDDDDPFGGTSDDDDPFGGTSDDDDPFGGDSDGDDPFGGDSDSDDPFGGTSDSPRTAANDAADDPFGGVVGTPSEQSGDDPFGDSGSFEGLGGGEGAGGDFGFGGGGEAAGFGGGGGGPDFDEEEFDSDIDRIDIGIEGLDEMILGGIPERSLMVAIGSAGTGKTTFGLQFLTQAMEEGGNGVYITLEESQEAIFSTAEEKGWPFREWAEAGQLAVVSLDPIEMANSLSSIRNDISRLVTDFGADRLVLDSVSLLEMMYDHPAKRRSEVFDFARSLKRAGVTTMLTSEASEENAYTSRYGIVEYLVDAVFILQYVRPSDFRETRLAVEIQKIRDANHSRETKPYEITNNGISVYRQANIF